MADRRLALVLSFDSEGFARLGKGMGLRLGQLILRRGDPIQRETGRFDSDDFILAQQGIELAVETDKGHPGQRQILSRAILDYGREVGTFEAGRLGPDVKTVMGGRSLHSFAMERMEVRPFQANVAGRQLGIALCRGWVDCRGKSVPVFRAVLDGPSTSWDALRQLASMMMDIVPCDLELLEGEAALALAQDRFGKSRKARKLGLSGSWTPGRAFGAIVRQGLEQIAANRAPVFASDTVEGVHQMRVGVRRLRSAISLFAPVLNGDRAQDIGGRLKELAAVLGPLRDGDVFKEVILDPVAGLLPGHDGFDKLAATMAERRKANLDCAGRALDRKSFSRLMLDILDWSLAPSEEGKTDLEAFAVRALAKRHKKLMKAGRSFDGQTPDLRHALRIRGKKMRYAGEFLFSLFENAGTRDYLEGLAELVEVLGHLNDIAVARRVLEERRGQCADRAVDHAAGFVEGWHAGRAALLEERARRAWAEFSRRDKFWT